MQVTVKNFLLLACVVLFGLNTDAQTENYWTQKSNFGGLKRERAISFTAVGLAYVGLGVDTAETVKSDLWSYDPIADSWTQKANMPGVPRRNAFAFSVNDKGYVGTGYSQAESILGVELSDFWEYSPTTNTWVQKASYPFAIYFSTAFSINGKGYVCGGKIGPSSYTSSLYEYNPVADAWTPRASFPGGVRYQLCSFVIDNSAYIGLGTDEDLYRKDFWEYKPALDQWIQKADLPASERGNTHTFTLGSRGFVCMGTNGGYLDDLWEYNPFSDSWSVRATYGGSKRKGGVGFALNGRGYVGIGKGFDGKKDSFYEYTPGAWVGMEENELAQFEVYPNPAQDLVHVNTSSTSIDLLEICTLQGAIVLTSEMATSLNIQGLETGVYFLLAKNANGEVIGNEKLIVR